MSAIRVRRVAAIAAAALFVASCGSSGGTDTTSATTRAHASTTTEAGIGSYDEVQPATIQIIAQGTLRDPEVGLANGSGAGSGFIISPDGLAVTNNHVVAGAATLEVFVGGDTSKSYNATILGVSECNDLALIDINESEPLPFLTWYDGEIKAGLPVYAAGYPLGDPEFTITQGIVAKAKAGGDVTGTSSIDHTLEHDANIQPGNSGGPLVSVDGEVVGINYAGGAQVTTTAQFYAIAADLAQPVIEKLKSGDFESLGINGWAVWDDAAGIAGIWVAGVSAGSPAAKADILPGDIVTSMNGLPVGTDGTYRDYCDVIRTAGSKPISVEVLRWDTSEILRGEINGDQPIELAFSFGDQLQNEVVVDQGATSYSDYQTITDDTGSIILDVPVEWSDVATTPLDQDGVSLPLLVASTDQNAFYNSYDAPGVAFLKLPATSDIATTLADAAPSPGECTDLGITDYSDAVFTGQYQVWDSCGGTTSALVVLAAVPQDNAYMAFMVVQLVTDADLEALDRMFQTFNVIS